MRSETINLKAFDCHFISNSASFVGGAVYWISDATDLSADIQRCIFENNIAGDESGGLHVASESFGMGLNAEILHCTFLNNTSNRGGALSIFGGNVLVDRCNFTDNSADDTAGGIYHAGAMLTILNSNFDGNSAQGAAEVVYTIPPECSQY